MTIAIPNLVGLNNLNPKIRQLRTMTLQTNFKLPLLVLLHPPHDVKRTSAWSSYRRTKSLAQEPSPWFLWPSQKQRNMALLICWCGTVSFPESLG
ncbi:hypothetical protein Patl1_04965 [Pistacia atlantica]|uniref:Uncharacterized protein n=1 Tax=Pistacia atlantica TaxID=434234 RepID=A0ACC1BRI0_9ROSI|nr:hypothetical protein Patl1_04965 [Pistacia atlantica]